MYIGAIIIQNIKISSSFFVCRKLKLFTSPHTHPKTLEVASRNPSHHDSAGLNTSRQMIFDICGSGYRSSDDIIQ